LGREIAIAYAQLGAKVVVNDTVGSDAVVKQIKAAGGHAVANTAPVGNGDAIVKTALDSWGRIDILINNPGITISGTNTWQAVIDSHLRDAYKISKAAWPQMIKQKYGRIINIAGTPGSGDLISRLAFATAVSLQFWTVLLI
jgi:multifunctional beta-oxidation protein